MNVLDLSVCIVSWNTREYLRQCLGSIYNSTNRMDYEVLVVDNGSTDGSVEMVRREFPAVRLFVNSRNEGFAAGANRAIRESIGRHILLLNSDTVVLPYAFQEMVDFLDADPEVGIVGCKLLNVDGTVQLSHRRFPTLTWNYARTIAVSKLFHHVRPIRGLLQPVLHGYQPDGPRAVDWVSGACLMSRREVFDRIGYLDETFFMFCEEIDWCRRATVAGWKVYYLPSARVIHYGGQSSKRQRLRIYWALARSTYHYFRKISRAGDPST